VVHCVLATIKECTPYVRNTGCCADSQSQEIIAEHAQYALPHHLCQTFWVDDRQTYVLITLLLLSHASILSLPPPLKNTIPIQV
jgi:hypothetical protein